VSPGLGRVGSSLAGRWEYGSPQIERFARRLADTGGLRGPALKAALSAFRFVPGCACLPSTKRWSGGLAQPSATGSRPPGELGFLQS
jgi:hypothetical protein